MEYKIEPQNCVQIDGLLFRPFNIDGKEVYKLNLSKTLSDNIEEQQQELNNFCEAIFCMIGVKLSHLELQEAIKNRKIYGEEKENRNT